MKEFKTDFVSSASCSDHKIRVKHETLMQDYQELIKETELKRRRLEMIKRRKSILMAEIRFLKRRCKHLKEDQILEETSLKMMKSSESGDLSEQFGPKTSVECVDLTQKNTICDEKEELVAKNAMYDLEKNTNRNSISVPEVNGDENSLVNSKVSSFDLNKISIEEEEEIEPKMTKIDDRNDEIKMSIYRKVKRKVSWQEPVAKSLRFSFDL